MTARVETSIIIARPVQTVFEFMTNPEKAPQWRPAVLEERVISAGPVGVGTTIRRVVQFLGRRIERDAQITEYAPNEKVSFKTGSLFPVAATYAVEAAGAGTKLTAAFEAEMSGFFRPAAPLLVRMVRARIEGQLTNLKNRLEAGA